MLAVSACTTGSGGSFSLSVSADLERADDEADDGNADAKPTEEEDADVLAELTIESDPDDASVYLNGDFVGTTPVTVSDLSAGRYRIEISADGYHTVFHQLFYDGGEQSAFFELDEITGFLDVNVSPLEADVSVDGERLSPGRNEVAVGRRTVRVRLFGYEEQTTEVVIRENLTVQVSLALAPAAYRIAELRVHRRVVNPESPGLLGRARANFWVSAPGTTTLTISAVVGGQLRPVRTI